MGEPGRILGIDYGAVRVGLAMTDPLQILASGAGVMENGPGLCAEIGRFATEQGVVRIVVGMPYAPDGEKGKAGEEIERFIARLSTAVPIPVETWDESQSSRKAMRALIDGGRGSGSVRKNGGWTRWPRAFSCRNFWNTGEANVADERWWRRILRWVRAHKLKSLLLLFLIIIVGELATIPWFGIARLKSNPPQETALMRQRRGEAEDEGKPYSVAQRWIPLARIPQPVREAIVVAEDGTFWSHGGFDWYEMQESMERNFEEGRAARGASTITQQLAKNLYLSTSKDPIRKAKEAIITLMLEQTLTKQRILELYVNCIEWGRGIFGIDAASRAYFNKPASELTLEEGARLAAVIPSPLRHRPDTDSRYVLRRMRIVLNRLAARNAAVQSQIGEKSSSPTEPEPSPATEQSDTTATQRGDGDER